MQISCKGYANNPATNRFNFDESNSEEADLVEHNAPRDAHQLLINHLIPDYNYSCSLLAAELDKKDPEAPHTWTSMIQPIQFSTLSISPPGKPHTCTCNKSLIIVPLKSMLLSFSHFGQWWFFHVELHVFSGKIWTEECSDHSRRRAACCCNHCMCWCVCGL